MAGNKHGQLNSAPDKDLEPMKQCKGHLRKPRVLSPLRSLPLRNEVDLVPLACEDVQRNDFNYLNHK